MVVQCDKHSPGMEIVEMDDGKFEIFAFCQNGKERNGDEEQQVMERHNCHLVD